MTGTRDRMREATTAELRLAEGNAACSRDPPADNEAAWLQTEAVAIEFRCGAHR